MIPQRYGSYYSGRDATLHDRGVHTSTYSLRYRLGRFHIGSVRRFLLLTSVSTFLLAAQFFKNTPTALHHLRPLLPTSLSRALADSTSLKGCTMKRRCSTSSRSRCTDMRMRSRKLSTQPAADATGWAQLPLLQTPPRSTWEGREGEGGREGPTGLNPIGFKHRHR
jgi:hypothetical protein